MSETFPFAYRVILLLGLMVVAAIVDYRRRGAQAERYREYGFICIAGMLGGLFGFANDCVTSGVSPEYFTLGKGLEAGGGLRWRAGVFGFKAGLSAGAVAAAICMFARGKKSRFTTGQFEQVAWVTVDALGRRHFVGARAAFYRRHVGSFGICLWFGVAVERQSNRPFSAGLVGSHGPVHRADPWSGGDC